MREDEEGHVEIAQLRKDKVEGGVNYYKGERAFTAPAILSVQHEFEIYIHIPYMKKF